MTTRIVPATMMQAANAAKELASMAKSGVLAKNLPIVTADATTITTFGLTIEPGWPADDSTPLQFSLTDHSPEDCAVAKVAFDELQICLPALKRQVDGHLGAGIGGGGKLISILFNNLPAILNVIKSLWGK